MLFLQLGVEEGKAEVAEVERDARGGGIDNLKPERTVAAQVGDDQYGCFVHVPGPVRAGAFQQQHAGRATGHVRCNPGPQAALVQIVPFGRRQSVGGGDDLRLPVVGQSEEQAEPGRGGVGVLLRKPRKGIEPAGVVAYLREQGVGKGRVHAVAAAVAHAPEPFYRVGNSHFLRSVRSPAAGRPHLPAGNGYFSVICV